MSFLPPFTTPKAVADPAPAKTFLIPAVKRFVPPVTLLEYAEYYITAQGWALCLLRPQTKMPMLTAWNNNARYIDTVEKAREILSANPGHGIGLIHEPARTGTFDVDHLGYLRLICADLGIDLDGMMAGYPRIKSRAGRDKILFKLPAGFTGASKLKLCWPDENGECDERGHIKSVTVFEFRSGANQDVLPPSIHPDTEQPYEWVVGHAPWDYPQGIPEAPAEILALWRDWPAFQRELESLCPWGKAAQAAAIPPPVVRHVSDSHHGDLIGQYNTEIQCWEILERNGYRRKGTRWLCPSSSTKIPGVVYLKDTGKVYSHHASDPINTGHAHDAFSLLTLLECHDDIKLAIKSAARVLGVDWGTPEELPPIDFTAFLQSVSTGEMALYQTPAEQPRIVTQTQGIPGVLGQVEDWINATSRKPQPLFAVQAALAFGATVAGRRFVTNRKNWPTLYFLNIGKSASGKEHAKTAIETLLESCALDKLIGPAFYTSDAGVLSALSNQPSHITIIDEFDKVVEAARVKNSPRAASAMTTLIEAWGRCGGTLRPPGYSTAGMSQVDIDRLNNRCVRNPALTLLAMTTPDAFFETVGSSSVRNGFLNRILMVETDVGRQTGQDVDDIPVPAPIVAWATALHTHQGLVNPDIVANLPANPTVIPFAPESLAIFREFDEHCVSLMDQYETAGLAEMFGRTNEIAMRLSLIIALSCGQPGVCSDHAIWARDYALRHAVAIVERMRTAVSDSDFEAVSNQVLGVLRNPLHAKKGCTPSELIKFSRKFRALDQRGMMNVLNTLIYGGDVARVSFPAKDGRGKARDAYVALDPERDA